MRRLLAMGLLLLVTGCAQTKVMTFTDVASRRTYQAKSADVRMLPGGAVNLFDERTGKAVVLQSWEAEDAYGGKYIAQQDFWGRWQIVPVGNRKPASD